MRLHIEIGLGNNPYHEVRLFGYDQTILQEDDNVQKPKIPEGHFLNLDVSLRLSLMVERLVVLVIEREGGWTFKGIS